VAPSTDSSLRCPTCGYCLDGLPANRCPECGTEFDPAAILAAPRTPSASESLARWVYGFNAACLLASLVLLMWVGSPMAALIFGLWAGLPYLTCAGATYVLRDSIAAVTAMFIVSMAVAAFAAWAYYLAFWVHLDPQSGLVVIFVPIYQSGAGAIGTAVAAALRWAGRLRGE
jgi:hypothetical protein